MKRICLFAGYNYNNKISKYVIDYIMELSKYSDVYYLADGVIPESELLKIRPYIKNGWVLDHKKYDFGSYSELAKNFVGWDIIKNYDELLLVNDSCMCVNSFKPIFDKMDAKDDLDAWGLLFTDEANIFRTYDAKDYLLKDKTSTPNLCIGTYFISIRSSFFKKPVFQNFLNSVTRLNNRAEVCERYEIGLYLLLLQNNAKMSCYFERVYRYSTTYMTEAFMLLKNGFPLLKVRIFVDNIGCIKNVDEIAAVCEKFCAFPYLNYVKNIRLERNIIVKAPKKKNSKKIRNIIKYFTPVFIIDFFSFIKRTKLQKVIQFFKKIFKYLTPEILHDAVKVPKTLVKTFKNKKLRFSLKKRPPYYGYYPCHIRKYNKIQRNRIRTQLENCNDNVVIFFNVMREVISGGMLSIDRLAQHSAAVIKDVTVLQSGLPLSNAIIDNPFFEYSVLPISFKYIIKEICPKKLLLNIPEAFLPEFIDNLSDEEISWLWSIPDLHINILNQADEFMPPSHYIEEARLLCADNLTITAAHQRYCTKEKEIQYQCPVYLLTPFLPNFYLTTFEQKQKIIIFSPDINEHKEFIVNFLEKELPDFKFVTISKMKLEDYKRLISKAMFTITFGEGYDGYFIEPALSGSISFAVYNNIYFPENMNKLDTLYSSWQDLKEKIVEDIKKYSTNADEFNLMSTLLRNEVRRFTNNDLSYKNLNELYARFLKSKN